MHQVLKFGADLRSKRSCGTPLRVWTCTRSETLAHDLSLAIADTKVLAVVVNVDRIFVGKD